jgi:predicted nucleotide-binding protein/Zn-dependent protease with chaperone function
MDKPTVVDSRQGYELALPKLTEGQKLDLRAIRDEHERLFLVFVMLPSVLVLLLLILIAQVEPRVLLIVAAIVLLLMLLHYVAWRLMLAFIRGQAIQVGPAQYTQIDELVQTASTLLNVPAPTVFILQGHGMFEVLVAKRFARKGYLFITSNLIDDLSEIGSSRELMFFVGRQLGLIATGFFTYWWYKATIGWLAVFFRQAWERRCHFTADRLGLLICGDLYAAEQALIMITAGINLAAATNYDALREQRRQHFSDIWSWVYLLFSTYPFMIDRIVKIREFAFSAVTRSVAANEPVAVGTLPIAQRQLRSIPLLIIHGHDKGARVSLENYLRRRVPHVVPLAMIDQSDAAYTLPEKFERIGGRVKAAVAIMTPDDVVVTSMTGHSGLRARQNVVIELGWFWGKLGRSKVLLLARGELELPSDLQGVELHSYREDPAECAEAILEFIEKVEGSA